MLNSGDYLQFKMKTSGYVFGVKVKFARTMEYCEKFIVPDDTPADFEVEISEKVMEDILDLARKEREEIGLPMFTGAAQIEYYEFLALHKLISDWMPDHGVTMFHCSSVMVDGNAYLFTAPSGTGKSTHAALWQQYLGDKMTYINDDKPFIKKVYGEAGCCDGDEYTLYACGSPWCGKHFRGENIMAPIKAIGIIVRDEKNFTKKVEPIDAFVTLFKQMYLPREEEHLMRNTIEMMKNLAERVPMYEIHCNMDIEAAKVAYADLSNA